MPEDSLIYIGFVDFAGHHTRHLASIAWVIYSPSTQLVSVGGVFLEETTNNIVKYSEVIEIL